MDTLQTLLARTRYLLTVINACVFRTASIYLFGSVAIGTSLLLFLKGDSEISPTVIVSIVDSLVALNFAFLFCGIVVTSWLTRPFERIGVSYDMRFGVELRGALRLRQGSIINYHSDVTAVCYYQVISCSVLATVLLFSVGYYCLGYNSYIDGNEVVHFNTDMSSAWTSVYFAFVTISTLGFGDIQPLSPYSRTLTVSELVSAFLLVVLLIPRFVALTSRSEVTEASWELQENVRLVEHAAGMSVALEPAMSNTDHTREEIHGICE